MVSALNLQLTYFTNLLHLFKIAHSVIEIRVVECPSVLQTRHRCRLPRSVIKGFNKPQNFVKGRKDTRFGGTILSYRYNWERLWSPNETDFPWRGNFHTFRWILRATFAQTLERPSLLEHGMHVHLRRFYPLRESPGISVEGDSYTPDCLSSFHPLEERRYAALVFQLNPP